MTVVESGNEYLVLPGSVKVTDDLLPKTYKVMYSQQSGFSLLGADDFTLPTDMKVFGNRSQKVDMIMKAYNSRSKSTGILLTGIKGTGKTLMARQLATAMNEAGHAVLLVSTSASNSALSEYLQTMPDNIMVLFDEFEKNFDSDEQSAMLPLFDGVSNKKHLYVVTANEVSKLSNYMISRPGRFLFNLKFGGLSPEDIEEYVNYKVANVSDTDLQATRSMAYATNVTYDILEAITFMLNLGMKYDDFIGDLNIRETEYSYDKYDITVTTPTGVTTINNYVKMDGPTNIWINKQHAPELFKYFEEDVTEVEVVFVPNKAKAEGITATVSKITAYDDDNDELITAYNLSDIKVTLKRSKPATTQLF